MRAVRVSWGQSFSREDKTVLEVDGGDGHTTGGRILCCLTVHLENEDVHVLCVLP